MTGLGIIHKLARSAQENGCAERFNRTWDGRVIEGQEFQDYDDLQTTSELELEWINQRLPSRGRDCAGRPPLEAYPEAKNPRRPYTPEKELELFSMDRIYEFLADQRWWRKVSAVGQISIDGRRYGVGTAYAIQDVRVAFDSDTIEFVVEDSQGREVKRLEPKGLTVEEITGLELDQSLG